MATPQRQSEEGLPAGAGGRRRSAHSLNCSLLPWSEPGRTDEVSRTAPPGVRLIETSLTGVMKLIREARLFVGLDSGLSHISTVMGTPTVCVCPDSHLGYFFPYPESFGLQEPAHRRPSGLPAVPGLFHDLPARTPHVDGHPGRPLPSHVAFPAGHRGYPVRIVVPCRITARRPILRSTRAGRTSAMRSSISNSASSPKQKRDERDSYRPGSSINRCRLTRPRCSMISSTGLAAKGRCHQGDHRGHGTLRREPPAGPPSPGRGRDLQRWAGLI